MTQPPDPSTSEPLPPLRERRWHAGTLTYTFWGLLALFGTLLLGDFALAMRERSAGPMAQWYLTQQGVGSAVFAILTSSFPALIALILGPIISVRSDRHRGPWGRRIPYLLITTPFAALGMIGLGFSPVIARWAHAKLALDQPAGAWLHSLLGDGWLFQWTQQEASVAVVCFTVFWAAFEFAAIAGGPVFSGLINDVVPRPLLGRFHGLFRAVSLIDGMIFGWYIANLAPLQVKILGQEHQGFSVIMIAIGLFFGICFMAVCLRIREGTYPDPEPPPAAKEGFVSKASAEIKRYAVECFGNRYYIEVFFLLMLGGLAINPVNTFMQPYVKAMGVYEDYNHLTTFTYGISLLLAWPLGWLADKFHPLRTTMVALAAYLLVCVGGTFFVTTKASFLTVVFLHVVISGCYFTSVASLAQRLFPFQQFAQFASAAGILGSVAGILFAPSLGFIIDLTGKAYRYTYLSGAIISALALMVAFSVHRHFLRLGGPKNYVAPE